MAFLTSKIMDKLVFWLLVYGQAQCQNCRCRQKLRLLATSCCKLLQPPEGRDSKVSISFLQPADLYMFFSYKSSIFSYTNYQKLYGTCRLLFQCNRVLCRLRNRLHACMNTVYLALLPIFQASVNLDTQRIWNLDTQRCAYFNLYNPQTSMKRVFIITI